MVFEASCQMVLKYHARWIFVIRLRVCPQKNVKMAKKLAATKIPAFYVLHRVIIFSLILKKVL